MDENYSYSYVELPEYDIDEYEALPENDMVDDYYVYDDYSSDYYSDYEYYDGGAEPEEQFYEPYEDTQMDYSEAAESTYESRSYDQDVYYTLSRIEILLQEDDEIDLSKLESDVESITETVIRVNKNQVVSAENYGVSQKISIAVMMMILSSVLIMIAFDRVRP